MSSKDNPNYFQDLLEKSKQNTKDDPYALDKFGETKKGPSRLSVKLARIKTTFFGKEGFSQKFMQGLMMGATVGGIFGLLAGTLAFYQTRNIMYIPISTLTMGMSFGFFMGVGTVVRSDGEKIEINEYHLLKANENWEMRILEADWKRKYRI